YTTLFRSSTPRLGFHYYAVTRRAPAIGTFRASSSRRRLPARRRREQFLQRLSADGFDQIAIETRLGRPRFVLRLPPAGPRDEEQPPAAAAANAPPDRVAVHAGHADTAKVGARHEARHRLEGFGAARYDAGLVSEESHEPAEHRSGVDVVVDDQDAAANGTFRHRTLVRLDGPGRFAFAARRFVFVACHGGHLYRERASPSETLAMGLDAAAVHLDERFHEREAEAEAAAVALQRTVDLLEHLENALELLGRNADPVVAHGDHDVPFAELRAEPHVAAGGRVLRGVAQQVREHLREADRIGIELDALLGQLDRKLVPGLVEKRARLLERALDDRAERDSGLAQLEPALRDARALEQIVDEPRELP